MARIPTTNPSAKRGGAQSRKSPDDKPVTANVDTGYANFAYAAFFNRYAIEEVASHVLMHFGAVSKGSTLNVFTATISKQDLAKVGERLSRYIGSLDSVPDPAIQEWTPPTTERPAPVVRIINCARADDDAETLLYAYSLHQLFSVNRSEQGSAQAPAIHGAAVALLTSSIATQKAFFMELLSLLS